jgi:hypothetical protein
MAVETVTNQPAKAPVSGNITIAAPSGPKTDILNIDRSRSGKDIEGADTKPAYDKAALEATIEVKQDSLRIANTARPNSAPLQGNSAADAAVVEANNRADANFRQESNKFAAQADNSSKITGNNNDIGGDFASRQAVIAAQRYSNAEQPFQSSEPPASAANAKTNPADRETDPKGILSSIPKGPAGPALAAPATGGEPAAVAPATPAAKATEGAPSSPAQAAPVATAPANSAAPSPEKVLTPVTAKVGASSPASPATPVENRPTGLFAKKILPNTVIEPSFALVAAANGLTPAQPKTGLASLPFNGAAHSSAATGQLLGITNQPATAMGDLGTSSALDAVKKREAEPVAAARQKPSRNNPSGMTLATSAAR